MHRMSIVMGKRGLVYALCNVLMPFSTLSSLKGVDHTLFLNDLGDPDQYTSL